MYFMQRHAWLASPALETSCPLSPLHTDTLHCISLGEFALILWCSAEGPYKVLLKQHLCLWFSWTFLFEGKVALQSLKGRGDFQNRNTLFVLTSGLSLMNTSAVCVPMFLSCLGLRIGLDKERMARWRCRSCQRRCWWKVYSSSPKGSCLEDSMGRGQPNQFTT